MKSADIDYRHTKQAALVMQADYKGDVKHELDDEQSQAISHITFDPGQNSIAYIGSQVEQLVGASQMTMLGSAEQTASQVYCYFSMRKCYVGTKTITNATELGQIS
ncbi:unnamed protein product [Cylicocyclus nassatus]|uniref:Uncharacterized protein n=1 Tax=Cylicocyclus nassatus TaxID=53992 RepID=A0AA36H6R3_CYLNA|nr:unnamed protein product [Cylicocyclus nassatus]